MPSSLNVNTTRAVGVVVLAVSLLRASTASGQPTLAQPMVSYDSVMLLSVEARLQLFSTLTRENKAEVINTHIQRGIMRNRSRLTPQQISLLEERMALAREELGGRLPSTQETANRWNDLQRRTARAFTWEDMKQATSLHSTYIPKTSDALP